MASGSRRGKSLVGGDVEAEGIKREEDEVVPPEANDDPFDVQTTKNISRKPNSMEDVSLGSLARFDTNYIDGSSSLVFATRIEDTGLKRLVRWGQCWYRRPPHYSHHWEPLVSNVMWINILVQSFYQVTVLLVLNFCGTSILHLTHESRKHATKVKNTVIFNSYVLCQVFSEFNSRKTDELNVFGGVMKNYLFLGVTGLTLVFQIIVIEFLGKFFSTVRLDWDLWLVSIGMGVVSLRLAVLGRLLPVPKRPFAKYFTKRLW
ncbi:Cation-transporting P-type ATPase, C-terminal [Dillenia turbinata]|uniref:Cation-transporting P-type ATPase, C-terminal n=1 Tax=Dillenia turbinata TaxID=194707 RepID=A0AAN8UTG6_9MAGN